MLDGAQRTANLQGKGLFGRKEIPQEFVSDKKTSCVYKKQKPPKDIPTGPYK